MRRHLTRFGRVLLVAIPSFVAGGILMAYLAATASLVSFQTLRAGYAGEEEVAAECARHRGDAQEAARHYANVVSTFADDGWWRKNPHMRTWPLWYPFLAITRRHAGSPAVLEHRVPAVEAQYRVRLANALSDEGRTDLASDELARAAQLYGPGPDGESQVDALRAQVSQADASVPLSVKLCRSSEPPALH